MTETLKQKIERFKQFNISETNEIIDELVGRLDATAGILIHDEPIRNMRCLHGCDDAILGIYFFPEGCICFPDKIQALCLQHFLKAEQNIETPIVALITFR